MVLPIISYVYLSILLLSALASILVHFQSNSPPHLKYFTPFLLLTFGVEIFGRVLDRRGQNNLPLYNCFTLFEFVFYFCILYRILRVRIVRKIILYSIFLYPVITLMNIFFVKGIQKFHLYTYLLGAFLTVGFCAFYFRELMKMSLFPSPKSEPNFWIVCGLFIYYSGSLPLMAAVYLMDDFSMDMLHMMAVLLMVLNYILYSLFALAFLCDVIYRKPLS